MKKKILDKIRNTVPNFVFDSLYEDYTIDAVGKIREEYAENNDDKMNKLKDIIGLVVLKEINIEKLSGSIKKELDIDNKVTKEIKWTQDDEDYEKNEEEIAQEKEFNKLRKNINL